MKSILYIGLGSNLGDRQAHLEKSLVELNRRSIEILAVSPWYENPPEGMNEGANRFLNGAAKAQTVLSPRETLHRFMEIELLLDRKPLDQRLSSPFYEPRTLDLDLLLWENHIINLPDLVVPHPQLDKRPFVLVPLNDIAPDAIHPEKNLTIQQLWSVCRGKRSCIPWNSQ